MMNLTRGDPHHPAELLGDEADGCAADLGQEPIGKAGNLPVVEHVLPSVGRAMHCTRERSVVLPEPLGLRNLVTLLTSSERLTTPRRSALGTFPLEDLPDVPELDHRHDLITESGSMVAARHEGMMVATV